ncbi:YfiR family protein [Marinobacter sp. F4206]|uniref:YfiR family protein n=1 Tax=Marinobacter sp. F4206 TaxID=2861777 RepID=UPI001C5E3888|nr:YfiR family protein [Marinobacter sp. F4206]MBW4934814.1 YfiR family protein [Marinobacter sp. F4206]
MKFLIALLLWSLVGTANASVRSEYEVKAAFLYNFTRFITWSDPLAEAPEMRICVLGQDPFGDVLQQLNGRVSQGRPLALAYPGSLSDSDGCQVLFIGSARSRDLPAITEYAHERQMLTISEIPDFVEEGGIIGYVKEGNVIRFEINLQAAQRAGIHVNSRLLELAVRVIR